MYRCLCVSIICIVLIIIFLLLELGKYIDEDGNIEKTTDLSALPKPEIEENTGIPIETI